MTTYSDTLIEDVQTLNSNFSMIIHGLIVDDLNITTSFAIDAYYTLIDGISASDSYDLTGIFNSQIVDSSILNEAVQITYDLLITEIINSSSSLIDTYIVLGKVLETIESFSTLSSRGTFKTALAISIALNDLSEQAYLSQIQDTAALTSTFSDLLVKSAILIEQIQASLLDTNYALIGIEISDEFNLDDLNSFRSIFNQEILDKVSFVGALETDELYTGYAFNPEGYALSTYSNYEFNSITKFGEDYLLANGSGLYRMGGTEDNLIEIVSKLKTASLDFGTSSKKQIRKLYVGLTNDSTVVLKVTVDGKGTYYYELASSTVGLDTQAIRIGKGLVGRYWQFEIITKGNSSLELDGIEFLPVEFRRKI